MSATPRGHDHGQTGQVRPSSSSPSGGGRIPVSFVAWGAVSGRSGEIADALGGEAHCLFPPEANWRPHALVRYPLCALNTVWYLLRRRPRSVVVTNPPVVAGLVVLLCARLLGVRVVLDSHPGGFGAQGDTKSAKLQWLHKWLVRHVDGVAVASEPWVEVVEGWGGRAVQVHEAPADPSVVAAAAAAVAGTSEVGPDRPLQVLCVGRLAPDEPSGEVIESARLVPDCEFLVTGNQALAPELVARAPSNVTFVGFLGPDEYRAALAGADVVMTLTTEPSSVMRAAYEAVYAQQPLIVTDWPIGRALFPYAGHVGNDAASIAEGVRRLRDELPRYREVAAQARLVQLARWEAQLNGLRALLGLPTDPAHTGAVPEPQPSDIIAARH